MKLNLRSGPPILLVLAAAWLLFAAPAARAGLITGQWRNADPQGSQGNGPIHNDMTASPIVGDLVEDPINSSNAADGEMFDSPFFPRTLANTGDIIIFTGTVSLTGTVNSVATSATPRTQFRFGLFDGDEAGPDDNGWVGYYMSNKHGNAGTPAGVLTRKPVGNTSVYLSVTGQSTALASVQGSGGAGSLFNDDTYSMMMTIQRNALGELLISATLTGANGFSQSLSGTDTTASTLGTYTFDHVGFLVGGNLDTDRAAFSNLEIRTPTIPEPATWVLCAGSLVGGAFVRRRFC